MTHIPRGHRTRLPYALVVLALALSACGGGSDDTEVTSIDGNGSSSTGSSGQNCHTEYVDDFVTEPGYCSGYICFNHYTKRKEKRVCD